MSGAAPADRRLWQAPLHFSSLLCLLLGLFSITAHAGCGGSQRRPGADPGDAIIRVTAKVGAAVVVINDREIGTVQSLRRGIALSPGSHRLEVRHPRYHSHYSVLELGKSERRVVVVDLAERLP